MTRLLLVEDREALKHLFSELIQNFWASDDPLEVEVCTFQELSVRANMNTYQVCVFNIASSTGAHFDLVKSMIAKGLFQDQKLIISSVSRPPAIDSVNGVEIHYCNEDRFASECLPMIAP